MNPLGTKADFDHRVKAIENRLQKGRLVKNTFQSKFKILIFNILDFIKIGHFHEKLDAKVTTLKKELQSDKFKSNINNFHTISNEIIIPTEWNDYLKEWKSEMCKQRTELEKHIPIKTNFKDYDYISALVSQVKACMDIQKTELSSQDQMARSFLNFVGEKIKEAGKLELALIELQDLEDGEKGHNDDTVYGDIFVKINETIKTVEPTKSGNLDEQFNRLRIAEAHLKDYSKKLLPANNKLTADVNNSKCDTPHDDPVRIEIIDENKAAKRVGGEPAKELKSEKDVDPKEAAAGISDTELAKKSPERAGSITDLISALETAYKSLSKDVKKSELDPAWLDKIQLQYGLKHVPVPRDGNCLFHACVEGIKNNPKVSEDIKKLDVQQFRERVVGYMQEHLNEFSDPIAQEISAPEDVDRLPHVMKNAYREVAFYEKLSTTVYERTIMNVRSEYEVPYDAWISRLEKQKNDNYSKVFGENEVMVRFDALRKDWDENAKTRLMAILNDEKIDSQEKLEKELKLLKKLGETSNLINEQKQVVSLYWTQNRDFKKLRALWDNISIKTRELEEQLTGFSFDLKEKFMTAWRIRFAIGLIKKAWTNQSIQNKDQAIATIPKSLKEQFQKLWISKQKANELLRNLAIAWNEVKLESEASKMINNLSPENYFLDSATQKEFMAAWRTHQKAEKIKETWPNLYLKGMKQSTIYGGMNEIHAVHKWLGIPVRLFNTPDGHKPYIHFPDDEDPPSDPLEVLYLIRPPHYPHFDCMVPIAESKK